MRISLLARELTRSSAAVVSIVSLAVLVACSPSSADLSVAGTDKSPRPVESGAAPVSTDRLASGATDVIVDLSIPGIPIDARVFGSNVPAWLGPERLADQAFIEATIASGTTLLRMPGGSWSNGYDWSACEVEDEVGCFATWAASPSEFIDFLQATGLPGMWTVSINETAESAAALVAFFNGEVDDGTVIGIDREGRDWGTVGQWAGLRAAHGNEAPVGIRLWEVGNEVYGGKPEFGGDQCAEFGWEDAWTCDGSEYVEGVGGVDGHDGYLAIRKAMLAVDSTIEVGAVGVADPGSWSDWGNEVISAAGDSLDFYVVHQYGFERSPSGELAIRRPNELWPDLVDGLTSVLGDTPIAITEYNLISFEAGDTERSMTKAMNALYIADSLGQLASHKVPIANQWNLANGTTANGSDYGLIRAEDYMRFPAFDAFRLWSVAGPELLSAQVAPALGNVRVYPTRHEDGRVVIMMINVGEEMSASIVVRGGVGRAVATTTGVMTDDLDAESLTEFEMPVVDLPDGVLTLDLPTWSITVIEVVFDG